MPTPWRTCPLAFALFARPGGNTFRTGQCLSNVCRITLKLVHKLAEYSRDFYWSD